MRLNRAGGGASVGFCFAKIAWQFAPHTRDGCCFLEGIL
jgi:hypothetical protein